MRYADLASDPLGTAHAVAKCCWCGSALIVNSVQQLRCWTCSQEACIRRQIDCALFVDYKATDAREIGLKAAGKYCWHVPLPSQAAPYEWREPYPGYLLWGGRAGPGKSTGGRWWLYHRALTIPGHEGLLLRENWAQLQANHTVKMAVEVPKLGGRWLDGDKRAVFGKGSDQSVIYCGHMDDVDAVTRYLGVEFDSIVPDEGSLYPVNLEGVPVLAELYTRARKTHRTRDGRTGSSVVLVPTNPGGPSAEWLRDMHMTHTPDFDKSPALRPSFDELTGEQIGGYRVEQWRSLPASLRDNPYMRADYAETDLAILSGTRYKQLAEGDWYAFPGAFFTMWDKAVHVRRAVWAN